MGDGCGKCPACLLAKVMNAQHVIEREDIREISVALISAIRTAYDWKGAPPADDPVYNMGMLTGIILSMEALNVPKINERNIELMKGAFGKAMHVASEGPVAKAQAEFLMKKLREAAGVADTVH